jgi:hypothetical protein
MSLLLLLALPACKDKDAADTAPDAGLDTGALAAVSIAPDPLRTEDTAQAVVAASGGFSLAWYVDGEPTGQSGDALDGAWFERGQVVEVEVSAGGEAWRSAPVSVVNTAPQPPEVGLSLVSEGDRRDGLRCELLGEASDADGDEVNVALSWTVDGAPYEGALDGALAGDTVSAEETARGRTWTCAVSASDGQEVATAEASLTLDGPVAWGYAWEVVARVTAAADVRALEDGTLLVATLLGELHRLDPETGEIAGTVQLMEPAQELISVVVDPDFGDGEHDWIYGYANGTCELVRYGLDLEAFEITEQHSLMDLNCPEGGGHAAGGLVFWDGLTDEPALYIGMGPSTGDNRIHDRQLLAVYIDRETGEMTPTFDLGARSEYQAAAGLRNPWRITDCGAALCIADPGSDDYEEVNLFTAAGQDFGWPDVEGPGDGSFEEPVAAWAHDETWGVDDDRDGPGQLAFVKVPTVSPRLSGRGYGGRLEGWALYGDIYDGWLRAARIDDAGRPTGEDLPVANLQYALAMIEAPDGTLYAAEMGGTVRRLILRADRPTVAAPGSLLSESPWAGERVDYEVRFPLWSNGADKERSIALPDGTCIDTTDPDAWVFPVGTHTWKTFRFGDGQPVETRVMEKRAEGWVGGVYVWDGEDAALSEGFRMEVLSDEGTYVVPSETACARCHDAGRGAGRDWPIGLERWQLGEEGMAAMADLFCDDPPTNTEPERTSGVDDQARGWLHGNCAFCHNPDGVVPAVSYVDIDWSYEADSTGAVNQTIRYYNDVNPFDRDNPLVIDPGNPEESMLITLVEEKDMPPLSVWTHDAETVELLEEWIRQME